MSKVGDKLYNTHLIQLWIDNNYDNYMSCANVSLTTLKSDDKLVAWLKGRYYAGDAQKISFEKNDIYLEPIRQAIKDNTNEIIA